MNYTLYVRGNCHDCHLVIAWMNEAQVPYQVADIDQERLPDGQRFFAAPALCLEGRLLAYGVDIIERLKSLGHGR